MGLKWLDTADIAVALAEKYPDIDAASVNFVDLRKWIIKLDDFDDEINHCGERVLEVIQMAWIDEQT